MSTINIQFIKDEKAAFIQAVTTDTFKNIFQKYSTKITIDLKRLIFLYKGKELNENLRVEELNTNENPIQIVVKEIKNVIIQIIKDEKAAIIQTVTNDNFKNIIQKYATKVPIDLKKYCFYYKENKIDENLRVEDLNCNESPIQIIVKDINEVVSNTDSGDNSFFKLYPNLKPSKDIICPTCREQCVIKVDEFKVSLEGCHKEHKSSDMSLIDFNKTQFINESNIICDKCKNDKAQLKNNIYRCLTCKISICAICKSNHNKEHNFIYLDVEKYLCKDHAEKNIFYCEDCKEDICDKCVDDHYEKDHKILYLKGVFEDRNIEDNFKDFVLKLEKCKKEMETILFKIKTVYNNLDIYYKIVNNLMTTYNQRHKNYITVRSINNLNKFNKSIIDSIEKIINESKIENKITAVFGIYDRLKIPDSNIPKEPNSIRYKIGKKRRIRIFGDEFVKNNKDNCKIIFDNNEQELKAFFDLKDIKIKDQILEIKLQSMNNLKNLSHMFNECSSLIELPSDLSNLKTENETSFSYMFNNCNQLTSIPDISQWDTKNIKDMSYMFCNCSSLKVLPNISSWNTDSLTDLTGMFRQCSSISTFPDISNWNTGNVTSMKYLFSDCSRLSILFDISKWDTKNVTDMKAMFENCSALPSIADISKWNTGNVKDISFMFSNCSLLIDFPNISNWNIENVINKENMFNECHSLRDIPSFIKPKVTDTKDTKEGEEEKEGKEEKEEKY
jgi:surface protein